MFAGFPCLPSSGPLKGLYSLWTEASGCCEQDTLSNFDSSIHVSSHTIFIFFNPTVYSAFSTVVKPVFSISVLLKCFLFSQKRRNCQTENQHNSLNICNDNSLLTARLLMQKLLNWEIICRIHFRIVWRSWKHIKQQEVLRRNNCLRSFDTTRTA
jgi:hypothetical protein